MIDHLFAMIAVGYVLGSIPFGVIMGRVVKRVDIRDYGSGKMGVTNVVRSVGVPAGALVLLLDMGKGVVAVVIARVVSDVQAVEAAAALAALVGHNWPVFIGFRGGRGTAPGWGGLVILSPWSGLAATLVALPLLGLTRYVSVGSLVGASVGAALLIGLAASGHAPWGYIWFGMIGGPLIVFRHKDNIQRLFQGTERKLGQRTEGPSSDDKGAGRKGLRWRKSA